MPDAPTALRSDLPCFLFIYLVEAAEQRLRRFCTVVAYGRNLETAERIAINRVHQQRLHIVRADTATAAPWLDPVQDREYLTELASYGCALRLDRAIPAAGSAADAA